MMRKPGHQLHELMVTHYRDVCLEPQTHLIFNLPVPQAALAPCSCSLTPSDHPNQGPDPSPSPSPSANPIPVSKPSPKPQNSTPILHALLMGTQAMRAIQELHANIAAEHRAVHDFDAVWHATITPHQEIRAHLAAWPHGIFPLRMLRSLGTCRLRLCLNCSAGG